MSLTVVQLIQWKETIAISYCSEAPCPVRNHAAGERLQACLWRALVQ